MIASLLGRKLTTSQRKIAAFLLIGHLISLQLAIETYNAPAVLSLAPGIALAGLVLGGIGLWPVIFISSLAIFIFNGTSLTFTVIVAFANTLQAVFGALLLRRLRFDPKLGRLRDMLSLMGTAFLSSVVVPTLGFLAFYINYSLLDGAFPTLTWTDWWTGMTLSILVITPFITTWISCGDLSDIRGRPYETVAVFAALIAIAVTLFWIPYPSIGGISLVYLLLIPLMWIALRFGARLTTLSIFLTTSIGIAGVLFGNYGEAGQATGDVLFRMSIFMEIIAGLFFIIAGVNEERRISLEKLKFNVEQLEDAVGMRDEFISIASHELKTPVTTLKIYLQMMQREFEQSKNETLLKNSAKMSVQLSKLESLVEDLLNVSRSRLGKLEFKREEFDLDALVRETAEDLESNSDTHRVRVEGSITKKVWGDRDRIAQVLINLVNNAIKYSPQAEEVVIYLEELGDRAKVTVEDFGIGIEDVHHAKIFDLFYRVSDSGRNTFPGFGIGLHISREIMRRHKGDIEVSSVKGKGSRFSFTIPYAAAIGRGAGSNQL